MSSPQLLPPNASSLEVSLAQSMARLADLTPRCREMWNPDTCPVSHLPWLAWALSVDEWNSAWSEAQKRAVIKASYGVHKHKGTIGALRSALDALGIGINVVEWFQESPPADPYTFGLTSDLADGASFVDLWEDIERVALSAKNVRSHLGYIRLRQILLGRLYFGGTHFSAETTRINPYSLSELVSSGGSYMGAGVFEHETVRINPRPPQWADLFANGEGGVLYLPGNESSLYVDYAGSATLITDEASVIANMHDLSGHNLHASRLNTSLRPKMTLLAASYRRGVDFDGVDDALNLPLPNLGNNVTIVRARPGIGEVISTGNPIAGAINDNVDHCGLLIRQGPLTPRQTEWVKKAFRQLSGMDDQLNVSYGAHPDEVLDIFQGSALGHPCRPVMLLVHGGFWRTGAKGSPNVTKNKLQHYLMLGYTVISMNYPMAIGTSPIDQARSLAKAMAWIQTHASTYGYLSQNFVLAGHSAGGHLVGLTSVHGGILAEFGVRPWLATICIDSAGYDLDTIMSHPHLDGYNEPWGQDVINRPHWRAGSPTWVLADPAVGALPPPMLLITSTDTNPDESDPNVGPFKDLVNARAGYERAQILQTTFTHQQTNTELGKIGAYTTNVDAFLNNKLGLAH